MVWGFVGTHPLACLQLKPVSHLKCVKKNKAIESLKTAKGLKTLVKQDWKKILHCLSSNPNWLMLQADFKQVFLSQPVNVWGKAPKAGIWSLCFATLAKCLLSAFLMYPSGRMHIW